MRVTAKLLLLGLVLATGCNGAASPSGSTASGSTKSAATKTGTGTTGTTGTGTTGTGTTGTGTTGTGTTGTGTTGTGTTGTGTTGTGTTGTGTTGTGTTGTGSTGTGSTSTDPHVAAALAAINASRATQNLPPYTLDPGLTSCGLRHATDCASCAGFSIANFATCGHGDFKAGDTCNAASENQGVSQNPNEDQAFMEVHDAMMAEGPPPAGQSNHYANIMNTSFTTVGIGLYVDSMGQLWVSEEFR